MKSIRKGQGLVRVLAGMMVLGVIGPLAHGGADAVVAYEVYQESYNYHFGPLMSHSGIRNASYAAGDGLTFTGYIDSMWIGSFSTSSDINTALAANSYIELSFQTTSGGAVNSYDRFYMNNYMVVTHEEGLPTFDMGLAYDNGSGSFSEIISGISPDDINSGIDISSFSAVQGNSTARLRIVFYNDHRSVGGNSALFIQNGTYGGVDDSAVVITGVAVPEPATIALLVTASTAFLIKRKK